MYISVEKHRLKVIWILDAPAFFCIVKVKPNVLRAKKGNHAQKRSEDFSSTFEGLSIYVFRTCGCLKVDLLSNRLTCLSQLKYGMMNWDDLKKFMDQVLQFTLFQVKNTPVTVLSLFIFILFITCFIMLAVSVRKALNRSILRRFKIDPGTSYTLSRITQYIIISIGALISFQFVGIDLSGLAVIFGLLSVGIGFGLQNVTSNFISGLIILFERPISVGDRVMVNDIEGDVIEINIRSTKVRTVNNVSIIVPNSEFVSKDVVNYSHGDPSYRLDVNVGVSYGSDLDIVLQALLEVAEENKNILKNRKPEVHLVEFGDSSWNMQLRVWIADVKNYPKVRNEVNQSIVRKFRKNDIEIPFPQRDLHVRSGLSLPEESSGDTD